MHYKLYAVPGWGSVLVEAQLAWYGLPYEIVDVDNLFKSAEARQRVGEVNPLVQVPTLVLPDAAVMTESAAITLHLADVTDSSELVPPVGDLTRPTFLRWLIFLVANIYPTFTFADDPSRFVPIESTQKAFRNSIDLYAQRLWRLVDATARSPWFLGKRFSAIDIYIATMTRWRPQRPWFAENCTMLTNIATRVDAEPRLRNIWQRNFPTA
jgi:GST-like protein